MATIFNSSILNSAILDSAMLHKTLTKLVQSDSNSFILALLDDISHLEFCHHGFSYFAQKKIYSFILTQLDDISHLEFCHAMDSDTYFAPKNSTSLIHSDSTWWLQPSWNLPSWIQPFCTKRTSLIHSHSTWWCSHLEFCHHGFIHFAPKKNFTHSFWLNLMMAAILNSAMLDSDTAILDSDTLVSSLRFPQKHSHSLILDSDSKTQTSSIWLKLIHSHSNWWLQPSWILPSGFIHFAQKKLHSFHSDSTWWLQPSWILMDSAILHKKKTSLIHSDSTWWWQPSWILPCWIQTLPSWIQTPCYLLSDSLKNTLPPLWLCLKLIPSD